MVLPDSDHECSLLRFLKQLAERLEKVEQENAQLKKSKRCMNPTWRRRAGGDVRGGMTRRTRDERAGWVWAFRRSGRPAASFCAEHGLSVGSLRRWEQEVEQGGADAEASPVFARMVIADRAAAVATLVVEVGGARVRVEGGFDAALLRAVVGTLREVG